MELINTEKESNKICATCVFCAENENKIIECRRKSPVALPIQRPHPITGKTELQIATMFPPVRQFLWCGEHAMKQTK